MVEKFISELNGYANDDPRTAMTEERFRALFDFLESKEHFKLFVYIDWSDGKDLIFDYDQPPRFDPGKRDLIFAALI